VTGPSEATIADLYAYIESHAESDSAAPRTVDAYLTAVRALQDALGFGDDTDHGARPAHPTFDQHLLQQPPSHRHPIHWPFDW
jgi:hypothetical protein